MHKFTKGVLLIAFQLLSYNKAISQIRVINMIHHSLSHETARDAEPNLSINPINPRIMVASAFTPDPMHGIFAPIFVSIDGGETWELMSIIPGADSDDAPLADITIRFGGSGSHLYAATLRGDVLVGSPDFGKLNVLRISALLGLTDVDILNDRGKVDQPYIEATTVMGGGERGKDKVYVGNNDNFRIHNTATMDMFNNADLINSFRTEKLEQAGGAAGLRGNEPAVRTTIHASGVAYSIFYRITEPNSGSGITDKVDLIVVKDEHWGTDPSIFSSLKDPDMTIGRRVVTGKLVTYNGLLGNNRLVGSNLSIAVDPTNRDIVYVAWADNEGSANTLHVWKSLNGGLDWGPVVGLLPITNATNPALAVNNRGRVGFLYQQIGGDGNRYWETHIKRSVDGENPWDDKILARTKWRCTFGESGCPPDGPENVTIGDYINLLAIGKDFYGIFSASNLPDTDPAIFPQGVTFRREHDTGSKKLWEDAMHTIEVPLSIDPFFFHVTELDSTEDFYVRDYTNSPDDFDKGLEPSIEPRFCKTSDVWNQREDVDPNLIPGTNMPPPTGDNPQIGGPNFAFARVFRKKAGPAKTVNLHFLFSEYGLGNNYLDAGTGVATLDFSDMDLEKTLTTGHRWELPPHLSTHNCLAVEISTPEDPIILPSLLGHVPGWGNGTDLMVINDNNKAQRNMGLYLIPVSDDPLINESNMTQRMNAEVFALIHNPGLEVADLQLNIEINPIAKINPSVSVVGSKEIYYAADSNKVVMLSGMKPGESRFLKISYALPEGKKGESFPVTINQVKNEVVINAFTVVQEYTSMEKAVGENMKYDAGVFGRIKALHNKFDTAASIRKNDLIAVEKKMSATDYLNHLEKNLLLVRSVVDKLLRLRKDDLFGLSGSIDQLQQQVKKKNASQLAIAHMSLLNTIDAYLTYLELEKGNTADILQTMYIQRETFRTLNKKQEKDFAKRLIALSDNFIHLYETRKLSYSDYPGQVKNMLADLKACVVQVGKNDTRLVNTFMAIEEKLSDPTQLQGEHIKFLLFLREIAGK